MFCVVVPRITKEPVDTNVLFMRTVLLECIAIGNSRPTIVWLHSGEPLKLDGRRRLLENNNQKLVITNVEQSDSGRYTCVAENEIGRDRISAYLLVIGMETFPIYIYVCQLYRVYFCSATSHYSYGA